MFVLLRAGVAATAAADTQVTRGGSEHRRGLIQTILTQIVASESLLWISRDIRVIKASIASHASWAQ